MSISSTPSRPKWISRSIRWKPRFSALASMRLDELHIVEQKFLYCDQQSHLKLGSGNLFLGEICINLVILGHTVYFALTTHEGKEICARKLKTKQLPQLQPNMIKKLLSLRHPNLLKYEQFCILKVKSINYVLFA